MSNILIIEDDTALCTGISLALKAEGNVCVLCHNLKEARDALKRNAPDLVLLDINLPDGNGLDFLQEIKHHQNIPVILLTANDMETDVVAGFSLGANDYVTKPFSLAILRARIQAQLRRTDNPSVYQDAAYTFDFYGHTFFKNEEKLELSKTEERLLQILILNKGKTLPRERLQSYVWEDGYAYVEENALSVLVNRLRKKLEAKESIKTIYGIGYCWEDC